MSLDLALDDDERLLADAVERFCTLERVTERSVARHGRFDPALWRAFCAQGFFELANADEGTCARSLVVLAEVLGRHALPGPVAETVLALRLVTGELAQRIASGEALVSLGVPPRMPHARHATLWLELDGDDVHQLRPVAASTPCAGLGAEDWAEGVFERVSRLDADPRALFLYDVALGAQLSALSLGLVAKTADHAKLRAQFGRPIGSFQAVSHPLADVHIALSAASTLARAAASAFDADDVLRARSLACAALVSSRRASLSAAYTCHQKLGALGITHEGPAHHVSRRIRSLATSASRRIAASDHLLLTSLGAAP